MELSFWSMFESYGVTSNLAAVSIMMVLESEHKIILAENHLDTYCLGSRLVFSWKGNSLKEEDMLKQYCERRLYDYAQEIIEGRLYYLKPVCIKKNYFDFYFQQYMLPRIRKGFEKSDIIFLDTENNNNLSTQDILFHSEVVIISLTQDLARIVLFMEEYASLKDKAVFIISQYRRCKVNKAKKLLMQYGISINRIAVIPYNGGYEEAMSQGRSVEFIKSNYYCGKESLHAYFIDQLKEAVKMILKQIEAVTTE